MRLIRRFVSSVPKYLLWLVVSTILWLWIFTFVTDTDPAHKVTLYAKVTALRDPALAVALEQELPEGIRMVKAHDSSYFVFGSTGMDEGDLYLMAASEAEALTDSFGEIDPNALPAGLGYYSLDGRVLGIRMYDAESQTGLASQYIRYTGKTPEEDYYLFFNAASAHCGLQDTAAYSVAATLLALP